MIAKGFLRKTKKGAVFNFFLYPRCLWSYLPLQTSVVEGSRSSGKSRGDEAIQSAGRKRNALPELDSMPN
jgi:hypothetical protein